MALSPGSILGKPTLRDLSNLAPEVDHKWYGLGVQLLDEKDVKVLSTIETDYRGDVETCCTKMFERWLDIVPTANWAQLITGLKAPNVKLHKLADELTKKLGGQTELNESRLSELSLNSQPYRQGSQPGSPYHSTPLGSPEPSQGPQLIEPASPNDCVVEFGLLVSRISEIIQNSSATNLASIKHALALVTVHKMSSQPLFSDAELIKIKQSKSICEIIEHCRSRWSWSNYSLLKLIVKKSGSEDAKRELKKFQRAVSVRQKVKNLGKNWLEDPKNYTEGYESMMVVLDEYYDDITVHQLEEVEKIISKTTLVPLKALEMTEVAETNSVLIKWRIPIEAVPFVVMFAFQNKEEFMRRSFLLLRIAGMDVFNLCKSPFDQLRRMNSTLSEDCDRYIGEVSELSTERDKLNEKVARYEEKIKRLELKGQEKDDEIKLQSSEIDRLGNQVKYLNKKVNTLQDHMRGKKPSLATTETKQKAQQPHHAMQQSPYMMQQSTMQQSQYMMQQSQYMMQQSQYMMQQSPHMMQQSQYTMQQFQYTMQRPPDEMMGISGGSLGSYHPSVSEAPSDMGPTRYGASGVGHMQAFVPETIPSPPPQSSTDLHTAAPTTVKDQITAINKHTEEPHTVYSSTKQVVTHQQYKRTKTPVFELVLTTRDEDELQRVFNRRSSKGEIETSGDYEEYVQQKVLKQRTKIEESQQTYIPEQTTADVYRKQQQQRYYMHYENSQ